MRCLEAVALGRAGASRRQMPVVHPPVETDLTRLVERADDQADPDRQQFDFGQRDLDVAADEQPLVEDAIEHFDQARRSGAPEFNLIRHGPRGQRCVERTRPSELPRHDGVSLRSVRGPSSREISASKSGGAHGLARKPSQPARSVRCRSVCSACAVSATIGMCLVLCVALQFGRDFPAVDAGQRHVEQDEVGDARVRQLERFFAGRRLDAARSPTSAGNARTSHGHPRSRRPAESRGVGGISRHRQWFSGKTVALFRICPSDYEKVCTVITVELRTRAPPLAVRLHVVGFGVHEVREGQSPAHG